MHDYELVKEFGEGVDRMFREMEAAGNPAPEYRQYDFMLKATLISSHSEKSNDNKEEYKGGQTNTDNTTVVLQAIVNDPYITRIKLSELTGIAPSAVQKHINKLKKQGMIKRNGGDFGGHWEILEKK